MGYIDDKKAAEMKRNGKILAYRMKLRKEDIYRATRILTAQANNSERVCYNIDLTSWEQAFPKSSAVRKRTRH